MKTTVRLFTYLLGAVIVLAGLSAKAEAAPVITPITGEIEKLTLNEPSKVYSGGVMIVGGVEVILPKNLLIDLPANRLSLQQIFDQAPAACKANGESGLAKVDKCNGTGAGGFAGITANRTNAGNVIAGDVLIQKGTEALSGVITYINYDQGYYRLNGLPNDPNTGVMIRLNDPTSRHTVQNGAGCAGGPNCSPDPRFTLDPDNYTNTFSTGYPVCIPSTVARNFPGLPAISGIPAILAQTTQASPSGSGDLLCPDTNRTAKPLEDPVNDSRLFAPVKIGDSVTAEGNFELINGVRFLSAHTTNVLKALSTKAAPGQPDYMFLEEVFIEAPGFQNQRARAMWIGFTTLAPTDVDIWSIHRDPATGAAHEFPLASVQGCENATAPGTCAGTGLINAGANIFRIRYDVDFLLGNPANPGFEPGGAKAKVNPCSHLLASRFAISNPGICSGGNTLASNLGIMSPIPHEIQARTGRKIEDLKLNPPNGTLFTLDINGLPATNGQYLFPLGLNLGGIEVAEFNEIDLNALNTPLLFEGIPWNLDRRLSPGGCLNGGCETGALGTFALDPFPFSGLDPRTQADFTVAGIGAGGLPTGSFSAPPFTAGTLDNVRNRIFSYVDGTIGNFNGNATLLPYALGSFPADPPLIQINPTPVFNLFAPVAVADNAVTTPGSPVTIRILDNDVSTIGTIDPASVQIVSSTPANGALTVNGNGSVTYAPAPFFNGPNTFTYTVASNFGMVSNIATVTVIVSTSPSISAPTAVADSPSTAEDTLVDIDVLANDTDPDNNIDPLSTAIVAQPANGTATVPATPNANGRRFITYAPNANFNGIDTFTYRVTDTLGASATGQVTVTVTPVNDAPLAADLGPLSTPAGAPLNIPIPVGVTDIDGPGLNPASINLSTPVQQGTATLVGTAVINAATGVVTYTPPAGFTGAVTFLYSIEDGFAAPARSNTATITVNVVPANETITVTRARFETAKSLWVINGTTNVFGAGVNNQLTVYNGPLASGTVIGTATADATGAWTLKITGASSTTISVKSTGGATRLAAPAQVR